MKAVIGTILIAIIFVKVIFIRKLFANQLSNLKTHRVILISIITNNH